MNTAATEGLEATGSEPRGVAEEVRDFYERMPYPPPLTNLSETFKNQDRRALFYLMWPTGTPRAHTEVLVAGCGTSQAARHALQEPNARITAIDISETSLRHTRELQKKYNLDNLQLHQLPVERVHELERSFDLIVCTGVLHHLSDPDQGLRALRNVLNPKGAMRVMVYAPYGRAGIYMMQEYCRLLGIHDSEGELRDLRSTLDALPADHPIANVLRRAKDFRQPEAMADALLHPRDRAYSVPELHAWLERCGMSFGRWMEQAPYLAQCGIVAKSPHAAHMASLPAHLQHAAVELFRGSMVSHNFVAYRDDYPAGKQPITFAGDYWRNFVPIPLPWTVCVRDRLPPGSVAVLINRAHTFTDLIFTVDAFEYPLLAAIDGERTLGKILQSEVTDPDSRSRALHFFERLWQWDHITFDASRVAHDS